MQDVQAALIAEQMHHALDLMRAEIDLLKARQASNIELIDHRLLRLEGQIGDHEARLQEATQGVTQFKVWSGLTSGSSSILAVAAFLKAVVGL
ncbi:MAG: hypothetical protein K8R77_16315 [Anaerolineaceae bacterium]|nr:hypothetical protein [Anaerolineaceae bacterium]